MSGISLSIGVRQALTAIKTSSNQATVQQQRLATGKRVNSAIDNPSNFFTASGLSNRARDLGNLLDSIGQATKVLDAADKGIKSLTKLVEAAQGSARQAQQNASTTPKVTGANTTALTGATVLSTVGAGSFAVGDTITVNGTTVLTFAAGDDVNDVINNINTNATLNPAGSPAKVQASLNAQGQLSIESLDGASLTVSGSAAGKVSTLFGGATLTSAANTNTTRETLAKQFDDLRTQINQLAADTGYNGINLLNGDSLKVQFNEKNTSSITVSGIKFDAAGLGIDAAGNKFQSDTDINNAISDLDGALTKLRSQASTFGSNLSVVQTRQEFTNDLIDTLQVGSDLLVLADQNEEAAKLVTLNTRQQLASTALSLASQAEQSVLRLF